MANFVIDGPVEISPELAKMLYESMPEVGRSGVAQVFAARLMSGPLSDKAVEAAAKVYAERMRLNAAGAKALRAGVEEKCHSLGERFTNEEAVRRIVEDEIRKQGAAHVQERIGELLSAIPVDALIPTVIPIVEGVVRSLAQQYFTRTQEGQDWILGMIARVKEDREVELVDVVEERMNTVLAGRSK